MPLVIRCFGEGEASSQSLTSPAAPWILRGSAARTNTLKTQVGGWCVCSRGESALFRLKTRLLGPNGMERKVRQGVCGFNLATNWKRRGQLCLLRDCDSAELYSLRQRN